MGDNTAAQADNLAVHEDAGLEAVRSGEPEHPGHHGDGPTGDGTGEHAWRGVCGAHGGDGRIRRPALAVRNQGVVEVRERQAYQGGLPFSCVICREEHTAARGGPGAGAAAVIAGLRRGCDGDGHPPPKLRLNCSEERSREPPTCGYSQRRLWLTAINPQFSSGRSRAPAVRRRHRAS